MKIEMVDADATNGCSRRPSRTPTTGSMARSVEFTEDLSRLMEEKEVNRAELARRMGTSRAYITKMLGGNANFTLLTMVKLAMALDGAVHIHISDKRAVTRWQDTVPGRGREGGTEDGQGPAALPEVGGRASLKPVRRVIPAPHAPCAI